MEEKKLIPGRKPVLEYLPSAPKKSRLIVADNVSGGIISEIIELARKSGIPVERRSPREMDDLAGKNHQGVILVASRNAAETFSLAETAADKGLIVILDQVTDPHNVGAIIRSAEALGARAVFMQKANAPSINATVVKSSAGATAHIHIEYVTNIARFMEDCKDAGFWIIGTTGEAKDSIRKFRGLLPAALVIGSEGSGMRRLTAEKCDHLAKIPLKGRVESLNASVAAGIAIYEILSE